MQASLRRWAILVLAVGWLFIVTFNYYIVHKPFALDNVLALGDTLLNLATAGGLCALALGIGTRALQAFAFDSRLQALVFRAGVGFGVISFATFALGLLGWLNPFLFWALLAVGLFLLRREIRANLAAPNWRVIVPTRWEKFLALFVVLTFAFALVIALTPPIEWDAQLYHLFEGKYFIALGRIAAPPNIVTFNYPSLIEMLYLAALLLKGDIAAKVLHWLFAGLVIGAVWDFGRRFWNTQVAWLSAATLAAIPTLVTVIGWAYSDAALALYSFGAFYAVVLGRKTQATRWLVLAGIFAGGALGTKNTAVIIPVALAFLIWRFNRRDFVNAVIFGLVALMVAAPWYIRNLIFAGNPLYPYFIGGKYWDAFRAEWNTRWGTGLLNAPLRLLLVPWDATINGQEGTELYSATLGPLMLAFVPLLWLTRREENDEQRWLVRDALIFTLFGYGFWLLGVALSKLLLQARYLIPIFSTLAVMVGVAVERLRALEVRAFSLARFSKLLIALILSLTLSEYALQVIALNPLTYLAGWESRELYLARRLSPAGYFDALQALKKLPAQSRIVFLWETRSYYAPDPLSAQPDQLLDTWGDLVYRFQDAPRIADHLRGEGFTHVLLSRTGLDFMLQSGYDPITATHRRVLEELATQYLTPVYGAPSFQIVTRDGKPAVSDAGTSPYSIYEIRAPGSPR